MMLEKVRIVAHRPFTGAYRHLAVEAPGISPRVRPGQFVHVRLPAPADAILRRPFSVFKAGADGRLEIVYKAVGRGTEAMTRLEPGDALDLIGPLGNGFPTPAKDTVPLLVAGGYGMAALYLQARESARKGVVFVGGRSAGDILCLDEFAALGWDVRVSTEDGSTGLRGLVTGALDAWLAGRGSAEPELFACGPNPMLRAVGERAIAGGWKAWLSMDRHMGCGVGACLTCVQKISDGRGGWVWARVCREGPVFECRDVVWGDEAP